MDDTEKSSNEEMEAMYSTFKVLKVRLLFKIIIIESLNIIPTIYGSLYPNVPEQAILVLEKWRIMGRMNGPTEPQKT